MGRKNRTDVTKNACNIKQNILHVDFFYVVTLETKKKVWFQKNRDKIRLQHQWKLQVDTVFMEKYSNTFFYKC